MILIAAGQPRAIEPMIEPLRASVVAAAAARIVPHLTLTSSDLYTCYMYCTCTTIILACSKLLSDQNVYLYAKLLPTVLLI